MEFVEGRRERYYYMWEGEETGEGHTRHLPLVYPIPSTTCSSSSTQHSSSTRRCVPTQQMESTDDQYPNPSASSASGGSCEQQQQQRPQAGMVVEKEHMFDKVVTPSDVGKLNRLVIPKQHAEKYFPLDASSNEKGLLLSFEDRTGKPWRFRYSYWNSSQSYVMTKGWSRFVKEKRLDAGDTVSFGRGVGDQAARDRLFIDCKRRPDSLLRLPAQYTRPFYHHDCHNPTSSPMLSFARSSLVPWGGHLSQLPPAIPALYDHHHHHRYNAAHSLNPYFCQLRSAASTTQPPRVAVQLGAAPAPPLVFESVPVVPSSATPKRVRLFGVNLDCSPSSESDPEDVGAAAYENSRLLALPPPQLSLGTSEMVESPRKGKQPMSLDLEM